MGSREVGARLGWGLDQIGEGEVERIEAEHVRGERAVPAEEHVVLVAVRIRAREVPVARHRCDQALLRIEHKRPHQAALHRVLDGAPLPVRRQRRRLRRAVRAHARRHGRGVVGRQRGEDHWRRRPPVATSAAAAERRGERAGRESRGVGERRRRGEQAERAGEQPGGAAADALGRRTRRGAGRGGRRGAGRGGSGRRLTTAVRARRDVLAAGRCARDEVDGAGAPVHKRGQQHHRKVRCRPSREGEEA